MLNLSDSMMLLTEILLKICCYVKYRVYRVLKTELQSHKNKFLENCIQTKDILYLKQIAID